MGKYKHQDHYHQKAKKMGLPSRASFKLEELLQKYPLAKMGDYVLDLGAAPGGWTLLLSKAVGPQGKVIAVDLEPLSIHPQNNVEFIQGDYRDPDALSKIKTLLEGKNIKTLFSDLSPKLTGIAFKDAYDSYLLVKTAYEHLLPLIQTKGNFVFKIFPGTEQEQLLKEIKKNFPKVHTVRPKATRSTSKELYVIARERL